MSNEVLSERKKLPTKEVVVAKPFTFKGDPVVEGDKINVTEHQEKNMRKRDLLKK